MQRTQTEKLTKEEILINSFLKALQTNNQRYVKQNKETLFPLLSRKSIKIINLVFWRGKRLTHTPGEELN